jgi:hypothetical protein
LPKYAGRRGDVTSAGSKAEMQVEAMLFASPPAADIELLRLDVREVPESDMPRTPKRMTVAPVAPCYRFTRSPACRAPIDRMIGWVGSGRATLAALGSAARRRTASVRLPLQALNRTAGSKQPGKWQIGSLRDIRPDAAGAI